MSDLPYFTEAPKELTQKFTQALDQTAQQLGRRNRRDDHVDWVLVNERMVVWWREQGYRFP